MRKLVAFTILIVSFAMVRVAAQQAPSSTEQQPAPPAAATAPQTTHTFTLTPADKTRQNPIRFTDLSVARGKELYETQCAMCHGEKGQGKGDLAAEMNINPPDFTSPDVLSKQTDGELFAMIGQGLAPMPGQSKRLTASQRWNLVNFLRSLQGKTPATATPEEREKAKEANTVAIPQ